MDRGKTEGAHVGGEGKSGGHTGCVALTNVFSPLVYQFPNL